MTKKNVVNVTIQGAEYTLRTGETMESGARIESHKAAILAALRIAGELFEARAQADDLAAEMGALSDEIRPWLPPAKRNG